MADVYFKLSSFFISYACDKELEALSVTVDHRDTRHRLVRSVKSFDKRPEPWKGANTLCRRV